MAPQKKGFATLHIEPDKRNYLGQTLKEIRKELGLTQAEAAAKLGISQAEWSVWELGKSKPNFDTILCIAASLEIHARDLITRAFRKAGIRDGG